MQYAWFRRLKEVNGELWLLLSLFLIAMLLNYMVSMHRVVLGFYMLPTVFSAYFYGKRHATLTAVGSLCIVVLVTYFNPNMFVERPQTTLADSKWFDIAVWGGTLMVMAYAMGTLYDNKEAKVRELRDTYHGLLIILRQFISKDKYTQNHSYRVSIYAGKIGMEMGLGADRVDDIRGAAMLHDIGKIDISRDLLYKAAKLTNDETKEIQTHVSKGEEILRPVGGALNRILPIILAHHDKFDGSGYNPTQGEAIPLEARIITVADVYDALTSDRPYRKALSPFDAKEIIVKGSGKDFDPDVVRAFSIVFSTGQMEIPELVV
jgi:HD-GYP domain-containing protein (c-di-GMP phosphodiesterase class II)